MSMMHPGSELFRRGLTAVAQADPATVPVDELIGLPPTAELRARLATYEQATGAPTTADGELLRAWGRNRVLLGERRDEIQRQRPEGCWCLGEGGVGQRQVVISATNPMGEEVPVVVPESVVMGFEEYCGCDEGGRSQRSTRQVADAYATEQRQAWLARWWHGTGLPGKYDGMTLDTYPVGAGTADAVAEIRAWLAGPEDRWLYLWGPNGSGKTGLATCAVRELVPRGRTLVFRDVPDLLATISSTWGRGGHQDPNEERTASEQELFDALTAADILVLDDLGANAGYTWEIVRLFRIVNDRYNRRRRLIVTSNFGPSELGGRLGDQGERIVWRILEEGTCIHLDGPNLRKLAWRKGANR